MQVKICGLKDLQHINAATEAGADFIGLVHFEPSPRHINIEQMAELKKHVAPHVQTVAVLVNPSDALLTTIVKNVSPDIIQLHGKESPERVAEVSKSTGKKIIKALPIKTHSDLEAIKPFENIADYLLFDAKAEKNDTLPGGLGRSFDWTILKGLSISTPWFLSGGLNAENITEAVKITGATHIDTSSGVESSPGEKSIEKINQFIQTAKTL